jgi:hypothetical protein
MREESKAATTRCDETTTVKEADLVLAYIVACIMLDGGVRGSNVAVAATEKAAPEPEDTGKGATLPTNQDEEEEEISDEQLEHRGVHAGRGPGVGGEGCRSTKRFPFSHPH